MQSIYAIPGSDLNLPAINKHCMGDCGRLAIGIMIVAGYPCYVYTHADCAHIETEVDMDGKSELTGQKVIGRKVKL